MAILGSATYKLDTDNSRLNRGLTDAEKSSRESLNASRGTSKRLALECWWLARRWALPSLK